MTNLEILNSLKLNHYRLQQPYHFEGFDISSDGDVLVAIPCKRSEISTYSGTARERLLEIINNRNKCVLQPKSIKVSDLKGGCKLFKIGNSYFRSGNIKTIAKFAKEMGCKTVEFLESESLDNSASTFEFENGAWAVCMSVHSSINKACTVKEIF